MDQDAERARVLERAVRTYFEACNEANDTKFAEALTEGAIHYFPPEVGGPYRGRQAIVDLWKKFVEQKGSFWTIDRLVCDGREAVVEWTHFKPRDSELIRGAEWYEFDETGKITEIRAYYASPRDATRAANELEGFPYQKKGFAMEPPKNIPGR